jgi:hypothetical protein
LVFIFSVGALSISVGEIDQILLRRRHWLGSPGSELISTYLGEALDWGVKFAARASFTLIFSVGIFLLRVYGTWRDGLMRAK